MRGDSGKPSGVCSSIRSALAVGTTVRSERLPTGGSVIARVVNCISVGQYETLWLLGLALDEPDNVWGIPSPPQDWTL
jgi:hypothetical protein